MIYCRKLRHIFTLLVITLPLFLLAEPTVEEGKTLFRNYCASCHAKNMKSDMTGPALAGLEERWSDYPREDIYNWVRNSQALIKAGHPRATELWNEWGSVMTAWPNLTDENVESIIAYVNAVDAGLIGGPKGPEDVTTAETGDKKQILGSIFY